MKSLLKIGLNKLSTDRNRRTALHAVIKNNQSRVGAELAGVLLEVSITYHWRICCCMTTMIKHQGLHRCSTMKPPSLESTVLVLDR